MTRYFPDQVFSVTNSMYKSPHNHSHTLSLARSTHTRTHARSFHTHAHTLSLVPHTHTHTHLRSFHTHTHSLVPQSPTSKPHGSTLHAWSQNLSANQELAQPWLQKDTPPRPPKPPANCHGCPAPPAAPPGPPKRLLPAPSE